jgi:hypothetical protein
LTVPEKSVVPSHDDASAPTRAPAKAQVIPLDNSSKTLSLFGSEQKTLEHRAGKANLELAPREVEETTTSDHTAARSGIRGAALAVLTLIVVAQAAYIAYDGWGRGAAPPPVETGTLSVTSEPSGAAVVIDGTARGTTPLQLTLAPGTHTVEVGSGAQARSQSIALTQGGTFALHQGLATPAGSGFAAGTGGIQVATEPAGARVLIDGTPHGVAPVTVTDLKAGDHVVTVRAGTGEPVNRTVTVQEGTMASLVVSMAAPAGIASGWLSLNSSVPLQILEKGVIIGTTETPRILLPTGTHELELVNAELGFRTTRTIQIAPGQTVSVGLKPPMSAISINAVPWAEVWIDGQRAGETPIGNLPIAIGRHEVVFRHPELGEQRRTVNVGMTNAMRLSADMRKK